MTDRALALDCPVPQETDTVQLAHGGGGRRMRRLIEDVFFAVFDNPLLRQRHDSAVFWQQGKIAFTTDSYVVSPLFFPGGDIGKLAVFGTVNDLAVAGARPLYLSASFILEEGLPMETLRRVVLSMREAADRANVYIVTGDTKVVDRGKGDGIFITTSGIGIVPDAINVGTHRIQPGDVVLVTGDLGRHGTAILSVRQGLAFESPIESDCAPLGDLVKALIDANVQIHWMRDLTRGGLAATLNEMAMDASVVVTLDEEAIPVNEAVGGACELLGLDPLCMANEGRMVLVISKDMMKRALYVLQGQAVASGAVCIGQVDQHVEAGMVVLKTRLGGHRVMDWLSGEQLPRIC